MTIDIDTFRERVSGTALRLPPIDSAGIRSRVPETVDALFHLPLLGLAILTIARAKPFRTVNLGSFVASLLVEHFYALRQRAHSLEASLTLRRRCVNALVLLETLGLVTVSRDRKRIIELTTDGKSRLDKARMAEGDLGVLIRGLRGSHSRASARRGTDAR
jgi:hypothetical protein